MKITREHKNQMYDLLDAVRDANDLPAYRDALWSGVGNGDLGKRLRWDLLYATDSTERFRWFEEVYEYADDTHVDTVLREWIRLNNLGFC